MRKVFILYIVILTSRRQAWLCDFKVNFISEKIHPSLHFLENGKIILTSWLEAVDGGIIWQAMMPQYGHSLYFLSSFTQAFEGTSNEFWLL